MDPIRLLLALLAAVIVTVVLGYIAPSPIPWITGLIVFLMAAFGPWDMRMSGRR